MRKFVALAAIMAALVTMLVSMSNAASFGGVSDGYGTTSAPQSDRSGSGAQGQAAPPIHQGVNRPNPESGVTAKPNPPILDPEEVEDLEQDPELSRKAEELKIAKNQLAKAEATGDEDGVDTWGPVVEGQTEVIRERIVSVTHKPVTSRDVIPVLRGLGLWGPTSKWAKTDVALAYATGRLAGYHKGAIASDEQGQFPARRQELAAVANRVAGEGTRALDSHSTWDRSEHAGFLAAIGNGYLWLRILSIVVGILLLSRLIGWLTRNRCYNNGSSGIGSNQPVWGNRGCAPAMNSGNLSAAAERCSLGRN